MTFNDYDAAFNAAWANGLNSDTGQSCFFFLIQINRCVKFSVCVCVPECKVRVYVFDCIIISVNDGKCAVFSVKKQQKWQ